jgi:hypothetical protein
VIDNYGVIYAQAVAERQQLAKDIFDRLRYVTTGDRPGTPITPPAANPDPNFDALRWLAQLAVNIVDFRDFDDYNTPFLWWTDSTGTLPPPSNMQYVYGTELPQLVLNEVYAESANDPADIAGMTATQKYMINFWVELVNPHVAEPAYLRRQHLKVESPLGIWDPYQIEVVEPPAAMPSAIDRSKLDNTAGDPDPAAPVVLRVTDFTPSIKDPFPLDKNYHYVVQPANLNMAGTWKQKPDTMMMPKDYCDNDGFYVVGPQEFEFPRDPTAAMPPPSPPYPVASVRVRDDVAAMPKHGLTREFMTANIADPANLPQRHSVLLRRLACPHMPPDATVGSPTYNPYITVDYVDNVPTQPAVRFDTNGMQPAGFVPYDQRRSKYRDHPFNSHQGNLLDSAPMPANVSHPQHTFFRHNINDPINPPPPFDWLVHLDRNFTSPIELLHVGGYRPFELTYKFKQGGNAHQHVVPNPWGDSRARVYRFLEFVDAGYRMNGVPQDGQVPGKININTIWDEEVLQAILDAQPNSSFQAVNSGGFNGTIVQQLFQQMMQSRSPQGRPAGESVDKPFKPLSTPYTGTAAMPNDGSGVEATILRQPGGALLFDTKSTDATSVPVIPNHPYVKFELLSKLFNNVTTRSNVFAVWLTVGFFEVIDEDTNGDGVLHPSEDANRSGTLDAGEDTNGNGQLDLNEDINGNGFLDRELLGEEIGRAENRHVRHRMFAIVDRTTMVMPQVLGKTFVDIKAGATTPVPVKRVRLNAPFYTEFKLREGMEVEIVDNLANPTIEETVQLLKVTYSTNPTTPPTIEAVFTKDHPAGSLIIVPRVLDAMPGPTMKGIIEQEPPLPAAPVVQDIPTIHGNPGPQLRFDHRKSKGLVPYYSIIQ